MSEYIFVTNIFEYSNIFVTLWYMYALCTWAITHVLPRVENKRHNRSRSKHFLWMENGRVKPGLFSRQNLHHFLWQKGVSTLCLGQFLLKYIFLVFTNVRSINYISKPVMWSFDAYLLNLFVQCWRLASCFSFDLAADAGINARSY